MVYFSTRAGRGMDYAVTAWRFRSLLTSLTALPWQNSQTCYEIRNLRVLPLPLLARKQARTIPSKKTVDPLLQVQLSASTDTSESRLFCSVFVTNPKA